MDRMTVHAAALCKVRALRRTLLSKEAWERLLCVSDFEEAKVLLTAEGLLDGYQEGTASVDPLLDLERFWLLSFQRQIVKIYHYYHLDYKRFLGAMLTRYDLEALKRVIRVLESPDAPAFQAPPVERAAARAVTRGVFDPELLARAKEIRDVIEAIHDPDYRELLERYRPGAPLAQFDLEMRMDRQYFKHLVKAAQALSPRDRKLVENLLGENIDLHNIRWILRAKRFYQMSNELIFTYTIPDGRVLTVDRLHSFANADLEGVRALLFETPYRQLLETDDLAIPAALPRMLIQKCHLTAKKEPCSIIPVLTYLHDWEYMIQDVMTVLEGLHYRVDPRPYLIQKGLD